MKLEGAVAMVTGGAGGLGEATVRRLVDEGMRVLIVDRDEDKGTALTAQLGERAVFAAADVTDETQVQAAVDAATALGALRVVAICHGAGGAGTRTVKSDGTPHDFTAYKRTIEVYLSGSFNVLRLAAATMAKQDPLDTDGERGVIVLTASIAGYEGTIGQIAYASAKGGVIGMTLVAARDLAVLGIRVATIAPGTFVTPAYSQTPEQLEEIWGPKVPFPRRMGRPDEYASVLAEICRNSYLNGEVIRVDGAIRFGPRYPRD